MQQDKTHPPLFGSCDRCRLEAIASRLEALASSDFSLIRAEESLGVSSFHNMNSQVVENLSTDPLLVSDLGDLQDMER